MNTGDPHGKVGSGIYENTQSEGFHGVSIQKICISFEYNSWKIDICVAVDNGAR